MAVCNSSAWDSKVVLSAYWVEHHQVSKTAPTGEYLTTGSFMIRGQKNFLPPVTLVLGFGILFKVDEASIANHLHERKIRSDIDETSSVAASATDSVSGPGDEDDKDNDDDIVLEELEDDGGDEDDEATQEAAVAAEPAIDAALPTAQGDESESSEGGDVEPSAADEEIEFPDTDAVPAVLQSIIKPAVPSAPLPTQPQQQQPRKQQKKGGPPPPPAPKPKTSQNQAVRGQRSKNKKRKDKYGDQDEEDRELAMSLLNVRT